MVGGAATQSLDSHSLEFHSHETDDSHETDLHETYAHDIAIERMNSCGRQSARRRESAPEST